MPSSSTRTIDRHATDSVAAQRLWDALSLARTEQRWQQVADLEDAAFRRYLPMARTLAHRVAADSDAERHAAEQAAELGLATAVLAWQRRTDEGFRRAARAAISQQLLNRR